MIIIYEIVLLKLSQAQTGHTYQVRQLDLIESLNKRLAVLGLNCGVFIELLALHKHGAVVKTSSGNLALGTDVLDAIQVVHPSS